MRFYYFGYLKVNFDTKKNQLGESSPNFIFAAVNLDPIVLEKRWTDDEFWPNDFVEKVNRGEDLRWVGLRYPLMYVLHAVLKYVPSWNMFQIGMVCHSEKCAFLIQISDWRHANCVVSRADNNTFFLTHCIWSRRTSVTEKQTNALQLGRAFGLCTNSYASGPCI